LRKEALYLIAASLAFSPKVCAQDARTAEMLPRGQIAETVRQEYADAVNACDGLGGFEDPAFTSCMQKAAAKADADVNAAFEDSLRIIVPRRRAELESAQKAWLAFYRANCDAEKPLNMSAYYDCIVKMAIERKVELRHRIGD
jgi:uncharacterized protein YecT (DUF1311 family)